MGSSWLKVSWHSDRKRPKQTPGDPPRQKPGDPTPQRGQGTSPPPHCPSPQVVGQHTRTHPGPQGSAAKAPGPLAARPTHSPLASSLGTRWAARRAASHAPARVFSGHFRSVTERRPLEVRTSSHRARLHLFICSDSLPPHLQFLFQPEDHGGPASLSSLNHSPLWRGKCTSD